MDVAWSAVGVLAIGSLGGVLNAVLTDNLHVAPAVIRVTSRERIVRWGLIVNLCVGAAATYVIRLAALWCGCDLTNKHWLVMGFVGVVLGLVGLLAARSLTNETDRRLLRVAVCKASAAPAAHPDTRQIMEKAPPYVVYLTADAMMPHTWRR